MRVEIAEFDGFHLVRAFGARDEGIFELAVAGDAGRRGVDRLGGLDVILLERSGERQFGGLHERKVARAGDLHRIGRRGVGGQPLLRKHGVHRETAHGAAEAGGSARWQRLDGDVDARTLHLAGHVDEVGTAPEEGIHVAASRHHDLRHGRQFGRLDHERPGLLRVEQVLLGHERLVDLAVEGLALAPGVVGIKLLRPESVERREFHVVVSHDRHPLVQLERHAQRLALVDRGPRHDGAQQNVVLGDLVLRRNVRRGVLARPGLRAAGAGGLALVHDLDRQGVGTVDGAVHRDFGSPDGDVARGLRKQDVGDRVIDAFGHRSVDDLDRLARRLGRAGDHVESVERRRLERPLVGIGVERELHAERFADGDRQRRAGLKSDLLGSRCREDRQREERRQGYFRNEISH